MAMPSRDLRDFLVTHRAESVLFFPEMQKVPFALVFRHSSNRHCLAAKRVGEETLQGFDRAPSLFLSRLDDSGDAGLSKIPVVEHRVGSCCISPNSYVSDFMSQPGNDMTSAHEGMGSAGSR
jgi:hypothetical protein